MEVSCEEDLLVTVLEFKEDAGEASDDAEEPDSALVDLGADDDLGQVGPGEGRHEVPHEVDELDRDHLPLLVDGVDLLEELDRGHLLQYLFEVGLQAEALAQADGEGHDLPHDSEEEDGVGYPPHQPVGGVAHHHHYHRGVVEQQKQRDEDVPLFRGGVPSSWKVDFRLNFFCS